MRQFKDNELNARIQHFLDKKLTKFPELRDSSALGEYPTAFDAEKAL